MAKAEAFNVLAVTFTPCQVSSKAARADDRQARSGGVSPRELVGIQPNASAGALG
jgi:hypothetical protein